MVIQVFPKVGQRYPGNFTTFNIVCPSSRSIRCASMDNMNNQAMQVKCPACGAEGGSPCKTLGGEQMTDVHTKRKLLALKRSLQGPSENGQFGEANRRDEV